MKQNIIGIQQVGIGIPDLLKSWEFYRKVFGMDIPIFQESAEAKLMTKYTGGKVHSRSAVLAINLMGGGGMEIWQYTSRTTQKPTFEIQLGDLGIAVTKIKSPDVEAAYQQMKSQQVNILGELSLLPDGELTFYLKDNNDNIFQVIEANDWFRNEGYATGGVCGAIIGVSDMERSISFYGKLLGYDKLIHDTTATFSDFKALPGGKSKFRRVVLTKTQENIGNFSKLLGSSTIELLQVIDRSPQQIFANRYWGDQGFIHLCFDVYEMKKLEQHLVANGVAFTVDSQSNFEMGEAAGHFSYIEDPDGTLIEFVETYKIPILKKIGWYLNLANRNRTKTLPDWMLGTLRFSRVKS